MAKLWAHVTDPPPVAEPRRAPSSSRPSTTSSRARPPRTRASATPGPRSSPPTVNTIADRQSYVAPEASSHPAGGPAERGGGEPAVPPTPPRRASTTCSSRSRRRRHATGCRPRRRLAASPAAAAAARSTCRALRRGGRPAPPSASPAQPARCCSRSRRRDRSRSPSWRSCCSAEEATTTASSELRRHRRRRDQAPGGPGLAADRQRAVPAPVRGGDGGGREALGVRRDRASSRPARRRRCTTRPPTSGRRARGCPLPLHHMTAVTYKGEAVVIGGFVPGAELTSGQSDRVFALRDGAWEQLPQAQPCAGRGRRRGGGRQDRRRRRPGGRQAGAPDRGLRRRALDRRGRHAHAARAPRARPPTAATSTPSAAARCRPTRTRATLERYDPESDSWTKLDGMPKPAGSVGVDRMPADACSRSAARATTSVSDAVQAYDIPKGRGRSCPRCPPRATASPSPRSSDSVYAIGGATEPGHVGSTKEAEVLDLSGEPAKTTTAGRAQVAHRRATPRRRASTPRRRRSAGGSGCSAGSARARPPAPTTAAYDRAINTWTTGPKLPRPLHHVMAVTYKGEAVVIGGFVPGARS